MIMVRPPQESWSVASILIEALSFDQSTALRLIDAHWLPYPDKDFLTWRVLERAGAWQPDMVDRCCLILSRTDVAAWTVHLLAGVVSMQLPDQAPRLLATWFKREWEKEFPPELEAENPAGEGENTYRDLIRESSQVKRCRELLEGHELPDLPGRRLMAARRHHLWAYLPRQAKAPAPPVIIPNPRFPADTSAQHSVALDESSERSSEFRLVTAVIDHPG